MEKKNEIKLFEEKKVRTVWDADEEVWFISIIDVIEALTETDRPRKYWNDLKTKLSREGSELSEKIGQLKMPAPDGKMRLTDVADTEQIFRLIQSIPSPKAGETNCYSFLLQLAGGDEQMAAIILAQVKAEIPGEINRLKKILSDQDIAGLPAACHHLVSSISPLGNDSSAMKK